MALYRSKTASKSWRLIFSSEALLGNFPALVYGSHHSSLFLILFIFAPESLYAQDCCCLCGLDHLVSYDILCFLRFSLSVLQCPSVGTIWFFVQSSTVSSSCFITIGLSALSLTSSARRLTSNCPLVIGIVRSFIFFKSCLYQEFV